LVKATSKDRFQLIIQSTVTQLSAPGLLVRYDDIVTQPITKSNKYILWLKFRFYLRDKVGDEFANDYTLNGYENPHALALFEWCIVEVRAVVSPSRTVCK